MILWSHSTSTELVTQELVRNSMPNHDFRVFPSPMTFTRWLFGQPRGDVPASYTLVVGWREAKPCFSAIQAAITGNTEDLRRDARRGPLPPPTVRDPSMSVPENFNTVVGSLVVLLKGANVGKVIEWTKQCSLRLPRLRAFTALSDNHLIELLTSGVTDLRPLPVSSSSSNALPGGGQGNAAGGLQMARAPASAQSPTAYQQDGMAGQQLSAACWAAEGQASAMQFAGAYPECQQASVPTLRTYPSRGPQGDGSSSAETVRCADFATTASLPPHRTASVNTQPDAFSWQSGGGYGMVARRATGGSLRSPTTTIGPLPPYPFESSERHILSGNATVNSLPEYQFDEGVSSSWCHQGPGDDRAWAWHQPATNGSLPPHQYGLYEFEQGTEKVGRTSTQGVGAHVLREGTHAGPCAGAADGSRPRRTAARQDGAQEQLRWADADTLAVLHVRRFHVGCARGCAAGIQNLGAPACCPPWLARLRRGGGLDSRPA
mmetsp:Transcript_41640/g.107751  ORF Transcript_41640/g.107751 Transcript_41640/m.107751 type:complete len:490 (+) Transcript_41640:62-1531(+)